MFRNFFINFLDLINQDVWVSLSIPSGVPACVDYECSGLLKWEDGSDFVFRPELMAGGPIQVDPATDAGKCFYVSKDTFRLEKTADCAVALKHAVCQSNIGCPGSRPSIFFFFG